MDSQKDVQKTEGAIKFLDYQTLKSSPFGDNRVGERVYRRAERIASAVVLLTNHIDDNESLKIEARKSSVEMLSNILGIRDEMRSPNSPEVNDLKMSVRKTISMVRLLGVSGRISFQNAEIVTEALDELLSFITASRRSNLSESVSISREDLIDVRESQRFLQERAADRSIKNVSEIKDAAGPALSQENTMESHSISTRSQAILEVLHDQGELGIRDIASNLPEYSEKMIQRELADLVAMGKVKKSGSKRWSRYTYIEAVMAAPSA
jgi:hypothetical protein